MTALTDPALKLINVIQGEFRVDTGQDVVLTTLLGSCVSVCLHDPVAKVGGLNHFLLPSSNGSETKHVKFGANAMELLINALLHKGAERQRLVAKMFGGGRMADTLSDVGASNISFARQFLADERIPCLSESVGGIQARRIRFWPHTGDVKMLLVPRTEAQLKETEPVVPAAADTSGITLFP